MAIVSTAFDTSSGYEVNSPLFKAGALRKIFDNTTKKVTQFYPLVTNDLKTDKLKETDLRLAGLEDAEELAEGQDIPLHTPTEGIEKTYTQRQFGIGFRMTHKMDKFNKYDLWKRWTADMARRQQNAKDIEIFVMFNTMTSTGLTCGVGFDTLAIANATHTGLATGTGDQYSNYLDAGLSQAGLESARYYFKTLVDDMGHLMVANGDTLIVEPTLWPDAIELTQSELKPGTDTNDVNIVRQFGLKVKEIPRLTSTTCWFVIAKSDENYDYNVFTGMEPNFVVKDAPDASLDKVALSLQYFTYGWGDPRLLYCGNT